MKKNPSRVTMLGASDSGRILTKAFHYQAKLVYRDLRKGLPGSHTQGPRMYFDTGDLSTAEYL